METVERLVNGATTTYKPLEVHLVSVSGWFDQKWLKFSGTVMHEIAVWMRDTTLPPFHPHRIESQRYYCWNETEQTYNQEISPIQLHIYQQSSHNLKRKISSISDSALLAWYTCDTKENGQGSLMVYLNTENHKAAWFISFGKKNNWQSRQAKGISVTEMEYLEKIGKQVVEAEAQTAKA